MAILNNLIVRGATRCLNTLYANSLQVDSQTISGNLTVNGYTYMGYSTSRNDTKLSVAGITNNQWYRSSGAVGWYNDSYGGGIYMTEPTYVKTYNNKAFLAINGLYTGASAQYYLNSNGKLNAVDGVFSNNLNVGYSIVARNVSVTNTLRAAKYDLQTVTQMGTNGTLYVAPSIQFPTSNTTSVTAASTSITIIDTNITSDVMAGVVWRPSARVKISGTINGVVTGTVDGTITSINTSSKTMVIGNLSGGNWSSVVAGTYTKDKIENLNIMMYETYQNSTYYPVGILLTSYGAVSEHTDGTAKTYIDIYGGSTTKPVVRLGNMTGLDAINGVTPSGWGLYTSNGYFSGLIVSNSGKIGGWSLSTNSLTTGTWGSSGSAMLCTGSTTQKAIGGSPASTNGWVFTAGANFGVTSSGALYANSVHISGEITATSGTIGGSLVSGELTAATINGSKITANSITASQIAANAITADKLDATTINASKKLTVGAMTDVAANSILNSELEIGGRNLFRYTSLIDVMSNKWIKNGTAACSVNGEKLTITGAGEVYPYSNYYTPYVIPIGTTVTLSCYFYENTVSDGNRYIYYAVTPGWRNKRVPANYVGLWQETFTLTEELTVLCPEYDLRNSTGGQWVVSPLKLEIGNKATAWSPAPEDLDVHKYITDIDSNKGITIKPADTSGNDYLQINSSAITTYRNNTDVMSLGDSSFRMGTASGKHTTVDSNGLHVWIGSESTAANEVGLFSSTARIGAPASSRFLLNADSLQAYNSSNVKYFEVSASGLSFGGNAVAKASDIPTTVAELTDSGSYLTTTVASNTYATQTNLNNEINARKAVYGTSNTDAGTATKAVTCSNFALYTGASVTVTFSKTNTSSAPQLNVNSTGVKPIKSYTGANLTEGEYKWAAGASITFTYDGTNWRMQDGGALQAKIDAASSASTASSQAGVATQQATNATNAKTAAESAKTAAESAKTAAQSAKTAAETASSQASSAKDTAVSAKNDAVSAKTGAETAKGQAQTAASNASQSATNAANSATAAAEVMGGFTILWNYSAFGTLNNGRGYLCAFNPATGTKSDANGWVKWNGTKRTITKQLINPSAISPNNIPIYIVCRLSSSTATTGTNYMVWYNSGWKSATLSSPSTINSSWIWADSTDIILGKFVETASGAALTEYEIYNPPYTSKQITTNVVTAQSASASAASAAQTATSYITYVNATDGIKVHNASDTNNYLQLNSSAINFYRNNVETLKIENSAIRVGKIGENKQNVYITDGAVQIRDNEKILAKFGSDGIIIGDADNLNIKITNDRMLMYSKSTPTIQLITGDDTKTVANTALYATFPFSTVTTKTYVVDSERNNFFKYSTSVKALFDVTDGSDTTTERIGRSFTFGTSASKTMSYNTPDYTFSCSCTIEYDGAYTFIIKNWTYSNIKRVAFYIEYDLEEAAPNVILGTTTAKSFGAFSVTEGDGCQASGDNSHAEGENSKAIGITSHTEGVSTIARGSMSHAEGYASKANGYCSHAQNYATIADSSSQTAIGKFNISDSDNTYSFIIGNGTSGSYRSNAFTVDWNGNIQMYLDTINVELDNSILTTIQSLGWENDVID